MGKISEIYLGHIDHSVCNPIEAGSYYYYQNTMSIGDMFSDEYEKFESKQSIIRREAIGAAIALGELKTANMATSMLAISALHNKVIVSVEV